jgi:hypothetical protein
MPATDERLERPDGEFQQVDWKGGDAWSVRAQSR